MGESPRPDAREVIADRPDIYAILHTEVDRGTAAILSRRIEAALGWPSPAREVVAKFSVRHLMSLDLSVPLSDIIGWTPPADDPLLMVEFDADQLAALAAAALILGADVPPWDPPETHTLPKSVWDELLRQWPIGDSYTNAAHIDAAQAVADAVRAARSDKGTD